MQRKIYLKDQHLLLILTKAFLKRSPGHGVISITVLIEPLKYEYRNKKEYVKKTKTQIGSKYKELLYEYFYKEFGRERENKVYGEWLDKYRLLHDKLFEERVKIERNRYYNLPEPLNHIDWRNPYDNIFVWEEKGKKVDRRGGGASSGSREVNSKFIYGLLELNKIILDIFTSCSLRQ